MNSNNLKKNLEIYIQLRDINSIKQHTSTEHQYYIKLVSSKALVLTSERAQLNRTLFQQQRLLQNRIASQ